MYFSTTLAILSTLAISSAIPAHSPYTRLVPRQGNSTDICKDGSPVDGPGENLNGEAAAEAHQIDAKAVFGSRAVSIKTFDGKCLTTNPCGGDFRQNLIPVQTTACDLKDNKQRFDIITKGKHIQEEGGMLVVSTLTNGCLNLDGRRNDGAANIFSCGGRAGGEGDETPAQIFSFIKGGTSSSLQLQNDNETCLAVASGKLVAAGCSAEASQDFTLG
ncbi:MAG: hypothetical protein Q9192_003190 [Flavoplaca navasiana]